MKVARILKIIVIIEWVLGFILGIISGTTGVSSFYSYYSSGFNILSMVIMWAIFFVSGMFQYAFAELLEHVAALRQRTEEQLYYLTGAVQHLEVTVVQNASGNNPANKNV